MTKALAATPPLLEEIMVAFGPREDLIDVRPEELGEAYVRTLDPGVRTAGGRHYTPRALAAELWSQTTATLGGSPNGLVLDPACGAGSLLVPAVRDVVARLSDTEPQLLLAALPSLIAGRDLDPAAVWLANVVLAAEMLPVWSNIPSERRRPLPALCVVGDGLEPAVPPAQVVVMNPPYGRVRLSEADRARHARSLFGHANIYALFMAAALAQVGPDGVVSALVPAGWLGGAYFQRLRSLFAEDAPLRRLSFVTDRAGVFANGVLQETVLTTFKVGNAPDAIECRSVDVSPNDEVQVERVGTGRRPVVASAPWLLPRQKADAALVERAAAMGARLGTYGWKVSTGPLVWNRLKDRLSRRPRKGSVKVLWAADIDGGEVRRHPRRNEHRYVQLRTERERRVFVLDRPAVLVQRTTAPEQHRRLLAAVLDAHTLEAWGGEVVAENHVNVLTCCHAQSALGPKLLAVLLDSPVFDRLYRCLTGSVAVSAYELSALPLPDVETVQSWAEFGDKAALQRAIAEVYGQTE